MFASPSKSLAQFRKHTFYQSFTALESKHIHTIHYSLHHLHNSKTVHLPRSHSPSSNLLHINEQLEKQKQAAEVDQQEEEEEEESFSYAMQLTNSVIISMAMCTAVELGVFDIIQKAGPGKSLSAAEIAAELSCKNAEAPSALDRLLRFLAAHSVLHCSDAVVHEENCCGGSSFRRLYSLTTVGKFFARNGDGVSLGPYLLFLQDKVLIDSWWQLKDAILEGGVAFNRAHGSPTFEYVSLDSRLNHIVNKAMVNQTTLVMNKILYSYKGFKDVTKLVDVGGGLGVTLSLITSKYPHIQGINFDLPHVIQQAPPYPGVENVAGDMFESVPKGDAIFMKWILHDWDDERCLKLLKNCYNAIPKDGKVIVVEAFFPAIPDTSAATKITSQHDLLMLTQSPGGRERSEQEFMDLATSSGFNGIRYECFACNFWVMEFFK